jgi:hypothetical protein
MHDSHRKSMEVGQTVRRGLAAVQSTGDGTKVRMQWSSWGATLNVLIANAVSIRRVSTMEGTPALTLGVKTVSAVPVSNHSHAYAPSPDR